MSGAGDGYLHVVVRLTKCMCVSDDTYDTDDEEIESDEDREEIVVDEEMKEMKEIIADRIARNTPLQNTWAHRVPVLQVMAHLGRVC